MHSTHRSADDQAQVVDAEPFDEQPALGFDHIEVTVLWKFAPQAIAWFARFSVADSVGQDEKKFFRIQGLAFAEQFSGKFGADKIATIAGCPVQNENGIIYLSARVSLWGADSPIMDS
jgi:hypothetical protein